jgi:hypothetical protein
MEDIREKIKTILGKYLFPPWKVISRGIFWWEERQQSSRRLIFFLGGGK